MTRLGSIAAAVVIALASILGSITATATAAGSPAEDSPDWSCVDDGNRVCGPGNANGAPAGCYDDGGVMVAPWPCRVVVNADGSADVYGP